MNHYYENAHAIYEIRHSILYITFKKGLVLTYDTARQIVHDRLTLQSYASYAIICDISEVAHIDYEARMYLSTYGSSLVKAVALLSTNKTLFSMARFYIEINIPKVPTRLFIAIEEAENYVKSLI